MSSRCNYYIMNQRREGRPPSSLLLCGALFLACACATVPDAPHGPARAYAAAAEAPMPPYPYMRHNDYNGLASAHIGQPADAPTLPIPPSLESGVSPDDIFSAIISGDGDAAHREGSAAQTRLHSGPVRIAVV